MNGSLLSLLRFDTYDDESKYFPSFPLSSNVVLTEKYETLFHGTENALFFPIGALHDVQEQRLLSTSAAGTIGIVQDSGMFQEKSKVSGMFQEKSTVFRGINACEIRPQHLLGAL